MEDVQATVRTTRAHSAPPHVPFRSRRSHSQRKIASRYQCRIMHVVVHFHAPQVSRGNSQGNRASGVSGKGASAKALQRLRELQCPPHSSRINEAMTWPASFHSGSDCTTCCTVGMAVNELHFLSLSLSHFLDPLLAKVLIQIVIGVYRCRP